MKTLIVEDDFTSRLLLQTFLSKCGECHIAANGKEAVQAFRLAEERDEQYDLICMDILMPEMDGHAAVQEIRAIENGRTRQASRVTIIMTTGLNDEDNVTRSAQELCDAYLLKPINTRKLRSHLKSMGLI
jgi:two-component system chemotaxis response regulator CheY